MYECDNFHQYGSVHMMPFLILLLTFKQTIQIYKMNLKTWENLGYIVRHTVTFPIFCQYTISHEETNQYVLNSIELALLLIPNSSIPPINSSPFPYPSLLKQQCVIFK
jgi:hypothetical protein